MSDIPTTSVGPHTLTNENGLDLLARHEPRSIDLIAFDPPYESVAHASQRRQDPKRAKGEKKIINTPLSFPAITEEERAAFGHAIGRAAKRWALVFCQIEAMHLWRAALEAGGMRYIRTGIWVKPDPTPQLTGDRPGVGYETLVIAHQTGAGRLVWNGGGLPAVYTHVSKSADREWIHPTEKPLSLMIQLLHLYSNPGELVVDPTAGSATTGVAAMRTGRIFQGSELDPAFFASASERLHAESSGLRVADFRRGQQGLFAHVPTPEKAP